MTIRLKIDNPNVEKQLKQYIKEKKEITLDVLGHFIDSFNKKEQFIFKKKDPKKHSSKIKYIDDNEDLSDVKPYAHIEDSASYIHNLRRQKDFRFLDIELI